MGPDTRRLTAWRGQGGDAERRILSSVLPRRAGATDALTEFDDQTIGLWLPIEDRWRLLRLPWFPLLLAAGYVLNGFADFHVHVALLPRPMLIAVVGTVVVVAGLWIALRRLPLAAAAATVVGSVLLLSGPLVLVVALATIGGLLVCLLERAGRIDWPIWVRRLNLYAMVLLAVVLIRWLTDGGVASVVQDLRDPPPAAESASGPDIYVVLLDGYPRADTQRSLFNFNPDPMLADLARNGFDHYPGSFTNYESTNQTVASMLYMEDLASVGLELNALGHAPQPEWRHALNANPAFGVANSAGYETVAVTPGWGELALRGADRFIETGGISQFEQALIAENGYGALVEVITPSFFGDQRRHRVTAALEAIEDLSVEDADDPRLIWVHVPAPHYPVLWHADGSAFPVTLADFDRYHREAPHEVLLAEYAENLSYLNRMVGDVVSHVVAQDPGAVVVLFSDHGSLTGLGDTDEIHASFLAARTPGHPELFAGDPTPRALLRYLFAAYFGSAE